jgi:hypothetical protein
VSDRDVRRNVTLYALALVLTGQAITSLCHALYFTYTPYTHVVNIRNPILPFDAVAAIVRRVRLSQTDVSCTPPCPSDSYFNPVKAVAVSTRGRLSSYAVLSHPSRRSRIEKVADLWCCCTCHLGLHLKPPHRPMSDVAKTKGQRPKILRSKAGCRTCR